MTEVETGELLLLLATLFGLTFIMGNILERLRIPVIVGALLVAMAAHYTPIGSYLSQPPISDIFSFLAQLGVLFLLFFIGLQIDMKEMRSLSGDIVWATILNTSIPFILGIIVMLALGYDWIVAFVIGLTRMPTAEAVIVPILDEFNMVKTRIGEFIIGVGVLDDVIEVLLIAFVSVWIGDKTLGATGVEKEVSSLLFNIIIFIAVAVFSYYLILPAVRNWLPKRTRNLILLSILVLFGFGGFSEYSNLGIVVGAIIAGMLLRPTYNQAGEVGKHTYQTIQSISYGFFGMIFFFWVGLSVDLGGMTAEPELAILLFLAAFAGKLIGIFILVPMNKLTSHEAWAIGIGLNARLTTEIIVAKLLLDAQLIDTHVFTALVAASSLSTIVVPLAFTLMIRKWGAKLLKPITKIEME